MAKKVFTILVILVVVVVVGIYFWQKTEKLSEGLPQEEEVPFTYTNPTYGYRLTIPTEWSGKYEIQEVGNRTDFFYSVISEQKEPIFSVIAHLKTEWEQIKNEPWYSGTEIVSEGDMAFIYIQPLDNPYSITPEPTPEADEFQMMVGDVAEIVKSFQYFVPATQLPNPASVYCQEQGGTVEIRTLFDDSQKGFCLFDDHSECEEWAFFRAECQKGGSFCKDLCGDGVCQEIVCMAVGCPCSETPENCPQDCK